MLAARIARAFFVLPDRTDVELAFDEPYTLGQCSSYREQPWQIFQRIEHTLSELLKAKGGNDLPSMASNRTVALQGELLCR